MEVVVLYSLASCFPRVDNEVRDVDSVAQVNEVNDVAVVDGKSNLPAPGASPPRQEAAEVILEVAKDRVENQVGIKHNAVVRHRRGTILLLKHQ
jgi:hypothetical protein